MAELSEKYVNATPVVSLVSGKGGVGKSVLAFNLAERMASMGASVLLVDADINGGNLHILANADPRCGLREIIRSELSLREAVRATAFGFDLLSSGAGDLVQTDSDITPIAAAVGRIRREASRYDLIVMDHGSAMTRFSQILAHASDTVLLVQSAELTATSNSFALLKRLKHSNPGFESHLVVNRVESSSEAAEVHTNLNSATERFLGMILPYFGFVTENRLVRESVESQTAVGLMVPQLQVVQQLTLLARSLAELHGIPIGAVASHTSKLQNAINKTTALADIRE